MVILKSLLLAGLVLTSAFAHSEPTSKPTMATLHVQPNFDFSLTSKEFRVHYSGLGSDYASTQEKAMINIYHKKDQKKVISYTVTNKDEKKAYYFALKKEDLEGAQGAYEVEVCAGSECSEKNPALTEITDNSKHQLACEEGVKESDGTWTKKEDFTLPFKGPLDTDWIEKDEDFSAIETELNTALESFNLPNNYKTDFRKHKLQKSPTYQTTDIGKVFYIALRYDVAQYKKLFAKKNGENDTRTQYSHDYCKRKYLLSAHAHLVDKDTDEVKYRFKTTLQLSGAGKQYYIMDPKAAEDGRKVHVEILHKKDDIVDGTYKIHVTFCATEKDSVDSTFCADPVIYSKDFVIKDSVSVSEA